MQYRLYVRSPDGSITRNGELLLTERDRDELLRLYGLNGIGALERLDGWPEQSIWWHGRIGFAPVGAAQER